MFVSMSEVKSKNGFSLIEVLVAVVILAISLVALMKTSVVVLRNNVKNEVRIKAVETLRNNINRLISSASFDNISSHNLSCKLEIRNFSIDNCIISDNITYASGVSDTKKIEGTIRWKFMGQNFSYTITTFVNK